MGYTGYTRWTLQGLSGGKAGNLKEVGLGWINGGRKDRGFGFEFEFALNVPVCCLLKARESNIQ